MNLLKSLWLVLLVAIVGCGGADNRITITGEITLDGQPLADATVSFTGNNGSSLATSATNSQGKFSIKTTPGMNKIAVAKFDPNAAPAPAPEESGLSPTDDELAKRAAVKAKAKPTFPQKYTNPNTSGLTADVKAGMSPISLGLMSEKK